MGPRNREGLLSWQSPACPQLAGDMITKTSTKTRKMSSRQPGSEPPPQAMGVWEPLPACPQSPAHPGEAGAGGGVVPVTAPHGPPAVDCPRGSCSRDPKRQALITEHREIKDGRAGDGFPRVL